jgi:hypothetical protein
LRGLSKHNFVPVLVTDETVSSFIDVRHACIHEAHSHKALKSDFVRLALLHKHGGVYMDASVIATEPLDWIIQNGVGYSFFQAFFNQNNMNISCQAPVIETSFLSAPPRHPLVSAWLDELLKMKRCDEADMVRFLDDTPVLQKNLGALYHVTYHVLTNLLLKRPLKDFESVYIMDGGNFLNFNSNKNVNVLCRAGGKPKYHRLLKLVSKERKQVDDLITRGKVEPGSFIDKFLVSV